MLRFLRRVSFTLRFLTLNPISGFLAMIAGIIVGAAHREWAVVALVLAGQAMLYVWLVL